MPRSGGRARRSVPGRRCRERRAGACWCARRSCCARVTTSWPSSRRATPASRSQETRVVDVLSGAECLEYYAGLAASIAGEHLDLGPAAFGYTRREPLGVVAGIGAWNYPLQIACWKAAPALACGNAMIFKPAELTPLTAIKLAEIFAEAGTAATGCSRWCRATPTPAACSPASRDIRKISLTGEVGTGKAVMADAAASLKQVTLELGGKSPLIVFEDAKLDNAVAGALLGNFYSAGEVCSNGTRVFVHKSIHGRLHRAAAGARRRHAYRRSARSRYPGGRADLRRSTWRRCSASSPAASAQGARVLTGGGRVTSGGLAPRLVRRADGVRRLSR